jgi:uncharacterized protein
MARLRVVLDTNVLVSGLAYPNSVPGHILALWRHGAIEVVLSRYILDEFARVLPKLMGHPLDASEIRDLLDGLMFLADLVEPVASSDPKLRDIADQPILGTLLAAGADYLITGDKDLLAIAEQYPIVTPATFWERYANPKLGTG